jgi:glucuronoarabinoxylan endo-1,4-beta-xylanase
VLPSSQITELYGQSSGQVGLSIMRVQIAPATWTSSTQTAVTSAWTPELTNAKAAQALGATIFATPWTPPRQHEEQQQHGWGQSEYLQLCRLRELS